MYCPTTFSEKNVSTSQVVLKIPNCSASGLDKVHNIDKGTNNKVPK